MARPARLPWTCSWSPRPANAFPARERRRPHPDGKTAYVANGASGTVTPIRTATNTALPTIKTGYSGAIAITP